MMIENVLLALGVTSILLNVWQVLCGVRFPVGRRRGTGFKPSVSVLKPLKGCDAETEACLESWFRQGYPGEWELLFAVASREDPVWKVVQGLKEKYPQRRAELILSAPVLGPNGKVSSLCYLSHRARFDHLVISDADVFVEPKFLSAVVEELDEKGVGLVNCFYILAKPENFAMRLEAVAVNADFWTQVLQGVSLRKMDFALGAVVATRRGELERIGGFESLQGLLADDYQLGKRIAGLGKELVICPVPVECRNESLGAEAVWRHQLRWARTIRVCQPTGYFFSIVANGTVWSVLAGLTGGTPGWWIAGVGLAVRMSGALLNYRQLVGAWQWWVAALAPVKDTAHLILWIAAFSGNVVTWSGERFRVSRGGKLTRLA